MAVVVTERDVLRQVLRLYKDLPCLWDTSHDSYSNREARIQALETLKDCYSKYNKNITVNELKKKLENMRSVYRREKNKMERSKSGDMGSKRYHTSLWYYQYFSFLHENEDSSTQESDNITNSKKEIEINEPERKKMKYSNDRQTNEHLREQMDVVEGAKNSITYTGGESSADTFGRYVSSQITEIPNKFQRFLAEKLIGDILFHAKLEHLNIDTGINLNSNTGRFPYSSLPYPTPHTNSYSQSPLHQIQSPNSLSDLQSPNHHFKSSQSVSLSPSPYQHIKSPQSISLSPLHQVKSQSISPPPSPHNGVQSPPQSP